MRSLSFAAAFVFVSVIALAGCDKLLKKDDSAAPEAKAAGGKGGGGCSVPTDNVVKKDWTFPAGCKLTLNEGLVVDEGATLTIEAGAKLSFGSGRMLHVLKGKLVARGTEKEPIALTSAAKTPSAGDWIGVAFSPDVTAGNVMDRVTIEFAGNSNRFGTGVEAAVGIDGVQSGRITITNCTFRKNKGVAVHSLAETASFAKLDGNLVQDSVKHSLELHANTLGSVGAANKLDKPVRIEGRVLTTQSWPKLDQPLVIGALEIGPDKGDATLTIAPTTTLKMEQGVGIHVGLHEGSGGLVAKNVVFTSAAATPAAGDWSGISFAHHTSASVLDGSTIEYAGRPWGAGHTASLEVIEPTTIGKQVKILRTTLRKNAGHAIVSPNCGDVAKPENANKSEGLPLCGAGG